MHKKILRIFSLALALILVLGMIPTSTEAATTTEEQRILNQISTLYKQTLRYSGLASLHGYCGSMVNWHLYLLGITATVVGNDGNTEYDCYSKQEYTTGGYRVRPYSATEYTLEESLNAITYNGTRDVYNIVVGFERTNTVAGRIYGHTCMIHAIIDGVVYFSESYATMFNGKYYAEGAPITCSISEFAAYYAPWTVFEGVLYFGQKTYAESCDYYHAYLYATVTEGTVMYSSPCTEAVDDRSSAVRTLQSGERITVTGLYINPEGEYWYQVEDSSQGYVRADATQVVSMRYDDIKITYDKHIEELQTDALIITGQIESKYNCIISVRTQLFRVYKSNTHIKSVSTRVFGNNYNLAGSPLYSQLLLTELAVGSYFYEVAAIIGNYFYADGCLQTEWKTVVLDTQYFNIES